MGSDRVDELGDQMYDRWSNNVRSLSFYSSHLKFEFEREELSWGRESKVPIQPVVALEDDLQICEFLRQAPEYKNRLGASDFIKVDRSHIEVAVDALEGNVACLLEAGDESEDGYIDSTM